MQHSLKILPEYFEAVRSRQKTFEIRKNDRDYQVGDFLFLQEYDAETQCYTGETLTVVVTYIFHGGSFGVDCDHVVMAISLEN